MIDVANIRNGEADFIHCAGIRVRVVGTGNLRPTLLSLDNVLTQTLVPIPMNTTTDIIPLRLANFRSQGIFLKLETTEIDEIFKINRVIVFVKPIYTMYPG